MGRIKTSDIKKLATDIAEQKKEEFDTDFSHNKLALQGMNIAKTKKIKNKIAGYITRIMKQNVEE